MRLLAKSVSISWCCCIKSAAAIIVGSALWPSVCDADDAKSPREQAREFIEESRSTRSRASVDIELPDEDASDARCIVLESRSGYPLLRYRVLMISLEQDATRCVAADYVGNPSEIRVPDDLPDGLIVTVREHGRRFLHEWWQGVRAILSFELRQKKLPESTTGIYRVPNVFSTADGECCLWADLRVVFSGGVSVIWPIELELPSPIEVQRGALLMRWGQRASASSEVAGPQERLTLESYLRASLLQRSGWKRDLAACILSHEEGGANADLLRAAAAGDPALEHAAAVAELYAACHGESAPPPLLRSCLRASRGELRHVAQKLLLKKYPESVGVVFADGDYRAQREILARLCESDEGAGPVIDLARSSEDPRIRVRGDRLASDVRALRQAVVSEGPAGDAETEAKLLAIQFLAQDLAEKLPTQDWARELRDVAGRPNEAPKVRGECMRVLGWLGWRGAEELMIGIVEQGTTLRSGAVELEGRSEDGVPQAEIESREMVGNAIEALGLVRSKTAVPMLSGVLLSRGWEIPMAWRRAAAHALCFVGEGFDDTIASALEKAWPQEARWWRQCAQLAGQVRSHRPEDILAVDAHPRFIRDLLVAQCSVQALRLCVERATGKAERALLSEALERLRVLEVKGDG